MENGWLRHHPTQMFRFVQWSLHLVQSEMDLSITWTIPAWTFPYLDLSLSGPSPIWTFPHLDLSLSGPFPIWTFPHLDAPTLGQAFSTFTLDDSNCQLGHGALNGDAFGCNNNNGKTSVYLRW